MTISHDPNNSPFINTLYYQKLTTSLNQENRVETPFLLAISIIAAKNFTTLHKRKCAIQVFEKPITASIMNIKDSPFREAALKRFKECIAKGLWQPGKSIHSEPDDPSAYFILADQDVDKWDRKIPLSHRLYQKPTENFRNIFSELTKALEIHTHGSNSELPLDNNSDFLKLAQVGERRVQKSLSTSLWTNFTLERPNLKFSPIPPKDPFLKKFQDCLDSQNCVETPQLLGTAIIAAKKILSSHPSCPGLLYPLQDMIERLENSPFKTATLERLRDWVAQGLGDIHLNVLTRGGYFPEYFKLIHNDLYLREQNISLALRVGRGITFKFTTVFNELSQPLRAITFKFTTAFNELSQLLTGIPAAGQNENNASTSSLSSGKKRRRDEKSNAMKDLSNTTTTSARVKSLSQEHFSQSSAPSTSEPDLTFISPFTESLFSYLSPAEFIGYLTSEDVARSQSDSLPDSGSIEEMSISEVSSAFDSSLSGSFDTGSHSTQSSLSSPTYFEQDFSSDSTSFDTNNHSSIEADFEKNSSDDETLAEPAPKRQKTAEDEFLDRIYDKIDSFL